MRDLPAFYYLDHLLAVLEQVEQIHGCALGEPELHLIEAFRAQPRMAQATWARMASRKGRFFTAEQLEYGEIREVDQQLERLSQHGFVRPLEERDVAEWLAASTKAQVRRYFPGSPSYSLGKLCLEHGIELRQHHRALDDALATAELVKRIHGARHGA